MALKSLAAAVLVALAGPTMAATCTETFNLGSMGPPDTALLANGYTSTGTYVDCYNFSLEAPAQALGVTFSWDASTTRNISIASVSLSGGSLSGTVTDPTAGSFSFTNLLAGAYQLAITSNVTRQQAWIPVNFGVGYVGVLETQRVVAAAVPEPETYAMLALGLGVVGWAARRRQRQG